MKCTLKNNVSQETLWNKIRYYQINKEPSNVFGGSFFFVRRDPGTGSAAGKI
jgi:hypothetical protein